MFTYYLGDSGQQESLSRCNLNTSDLWPVESRDVELVGPENPRPMHALVYSYGRPPACPLQTGGDTLHQGVWQGYFCAQWVLQKYSQDTFKKDILEGQFE